MGETPEQKSVLVFQSGAFDTTWEETQPGTQTTPPGRDLAIYLASRLGEKGISVDEPDEADESGWMFSISHKGNKYNVFVNWYPTVFGRPPDDRWAVQIRKCTGFIGFLLGCFGHHDFECVQPIRDVLDEIVKADARISDVTWLSFAESVNKEIDR